MREIDFRKIDLNLLVIFEAIYACRNISQAAAQLGMSQPTMSNSLARLRMQLDDQLFTRMDRGVAPTAFADSVIMTVRSALNTLRHGLQTRGAFDHANAQRTFRMSMHGFSTVHILPRILKSLKCVAPGVVLEVFTPDWQSPFEILTSGRVDLAIDTFPQEDPNIEFESLYYVKPVVIARKGHPAIHGAMTKELFAALDHISLPEGAVRRIQIDSALLSSGISRRIACQVGSSSEIGPLVASTDLISVVPERYGLTLAHTHGIQVFDVPFSMRGEMLFAGWLRQRTNDPGLAWLCDQVKEATRAFEPIAPAAALRAALPN